MIPGSSSAVPDDLPGVLLRRLEEELEDETVLVEALAHEPGLVFPGSVK